MKKTTRDKSSHFSQNQRREDSKRKDFSGGPVARPPHSGCRALGSSLLGGRGPTRRAKDAMCHSKDPTPCLGLPRRPAYHGRDAGFVPGLGGSHVPQGNPAHEPQLLSLSAQSLCSMTREATNVKSPHTGLEGSPGLGGEALAQP